MRNYIIASFAISLIIILSILVISTLHIGTLCAMSGLLAAALMFMGVMSDSLGSDVEIDDAEGSITYMLSLIGAIYVATPEEQAAMQLASRITTRQEICLNAIEAALLLAETPTQRSARLTANASYEVVVDLTDHAISIDAPVVRIQREAFSMEQQLVTTAYDIEGVMANMQWAC